MNIKLNPVALLTLAVLAGSVPACGYAQGTSYRAVAAPELTPIPRIDSFALRQQETHSAVGLKPRNGIAGDGIDLPFGMNYSIGSRSLLVPIDAKNDWGIGLNLNVNSARALDLTPSSGLGLQPKRTPGVTLQKRF